MLEVRLTFLDIKSYEYIIWRLFRRDCCIKKVIWNIDVYIINNSILYMNFYNVAVPLFCAFCLEKYQDSIFKRVKMGYNNKKCIYICMCII